MSSSGDTGAAEAALVSPFGVGKNFLRNLQNWGLTFFMFMLY